MMKKIAIGFGVFLAIAGALVALSTVYAAEIPKALLKIEANYTKAKTLEAEFDQTNFSALTGVKKQSSGHVSLKYPNKFRWETIKPDKNLLVSDGRLFWFYTPPFEKGERGQVIQKRTSEVQSQLASALLSGAFSKIKNLKVQKISEQKYRLTPLKGSAGTVKTAEITIDTKKNLIESVKLDHTGGNTAEIKLQKITPKTKLDDALFSFITPPDTDIIKE